jgi:hypothetical protein
MESALAPTAYEVNDELGQAQVSQNHKCGEEGKLRPVE